MTSSEWTKYQLRQLVEYSNHLTVSPFLSIEIYEEAQLKQLVVSESINEEDKRYRDCYIDWEGYDESIDNA